MAAHIGRGIYHCTLSPLSILSHRHILIPNPGFKPSSSIAHPYTSTPRCTVIHDVSPSASRSPNLSVRSRFDPPCLFPLRLDSSGPSHGRTKSGCTKRHGCRRGASLVVVSVGYKETPCLWQGPSVPPILDWKLRRKPRWGFEREINWCPRYPPEETQGRRKVYWT